MISGMLAFLMKTKIGALLNFQRMTGGVNWLNLLVIKSDTMISLETDQHNINRMNAALNVFHPTQKDKDNIKRADQWVQDHKEFIDSLQAFTDSTNKIIEVIDRNFNYNAQKASNMVIDLANKVGASHNWDMNYAIDKVSVQNISSFLKRERAKRYNSIYKSQSGKSKH